ncbi:MAG TPA: BatA domain-containing protein [Bacteroidales bacterium]|nr:BatA domain-containing protein [Bacteroidales bacterium]HPS17860.1 BatA domain-containing protein [Bacteroidales bacterium]
MKFVNPYFLFALFTIAIPVIIHLFNFRRYRRILFSNVSFLKEIKQETQKKSKIKHFLILLARILTISSLVLAFAQPYIPLGAKVINKKGSVVSIYIDNSFSMQSIGKKGTLLEEAISKAKEIAESYKPADIFQLLTNDFEGKHQFYYTKEEFLQLLNEVAVSPSVKKLSEILTRQNDLFSTVKSKEKVSFIISDFSEMNFDFDKLKIDTSVYIHLIPLTANEKNNLFIDSCWYDTPVIQMGKQVQLSVLIKNISNEDAEKIPLKLVINGKQKSLASVDITAGSETEAKLSYTISEVGMQNAYVEIIDNPVVFDDKFYFSYEVAQKIKVLNICQSENIYINALFQNDSLIDYKILNINKLDYSSIPQSDFVIIDGIKTISSGLEKELLKYTMNGGTLAVFPGVEMDINSYNSFLNAMSAPVFQKLDTADTKVSKVNEEHKIFTDVFEKVSDDMDLPIVKSHYPLKSKTLSSDEKIMELQNGEPFILSYKYGKGNLYISSVPVDAEFSNFPKHAIFVPALYNMTLFSIPARKLFYTIGDDESIEVKKQDLSGDMTFKIRSSEKKFEIIPEHKNMDMQTYIYPHDQIKEAGNYIIKLGNNDIAGVSFNYNRNESVMKFETDEQISDEIKAATAKSESYKKIDVLDLKSKTVSKAIEEINQGVRLWKLFIFLSLVFIFAEIALLRYVRD